jgi:hypothetical protein
MSVGPMLGLNANISAAGSPLAQAKGSEAERASQDVGAQQRQTRFEQKAEAAAGIGETDGDNNQPNERDADGRRLWEAPAKKRQDADDETVDPSDIKLPSVRDPSGDSGNLLDLSG